MASSTYLWVGLLLVIVCLFNLSKEMCHSVDTGLGVEFSETRNSLVNESRFDLDSPKSNFGRTSDSAFNWNVMQVAENVTGMCGFFKCFWRSTSDPESVGYLVVSASKHYRYMKKAYKFAVDVLEEKCRVRHLLLAAPERVKVAPDFPQKLNSLTYSDQAEFNDQNKDLLLKVRETPHSEHRVFKESDPYLVVQKVTVMPEPNLVFASKPDKWIKMIETDIPRFRSELQDKGVPLPHIQEKLELERKGIECAMQYSETYWYDLQGFVDLKGNYFHNDLDSQFWRKVGEKRSKSKSGVVTVTEEKAEQRRQGNIGKFTEMIQRLIDPPPDDVNK